MPTATRVSFPVESLEGCETALIVFAAAFGGRNDAAYIRDAGLLATCVDHDGDKLRAMAGDYPEDWRFIVGDAFTLLDAPYRTFDVVTLDPWTGVMMERTLARLADFARLARKRLIAGTDGRDIQLVGWELVTTVRRSEIAWWAVFRRS